MEFIKTNIEGVVILQPRIFKDARGYFFESFKESEFQENVCRTTFVQDNESYSSYGVVRGLHFQKPPYSQAKLVRVIKGAVLDVAVDLRPNSPTYKQWIAVELSAENKKQLMIPRGFGHGFVTLTDDVEFLYKADNFYAPEADGSIRWNDPELNIDWGTESPILSDKDANAPFLKDAVTGF